MSGRGRLTPTERARRAAGYHSIEFLLMVVLLTAWAYLGVAAPLLGPGVMAGGVAFVLVQCLFVPSIVAYVVVKKFRRSRRERRSLALLPELRRALTDYARGAANGAAVRGHYRRHPAITEQAMLEFVPAVIGSQRDRLVALADEFGLQARWERKLESGVAADRRTAVAALATMATPSALESLRVAMQDDVANVRADAYGAVLRLGPDEDVVSVVVKALGENLLTRAMLAEEIRRHAATLAGSVIPELLEAEEELLVRALDLLASWRVLVRLDAMGQLLDHHDPRVVRRALEILPFTPERARFADLVVERLSAAAPDVRRAAAFCAGRTRLVEAAPVLSRMLYDENTTAARAAAVALARLGPAGRSYLDDAVVARDRRGAGLALEALEHDRVMPRLAVGE